MSMTRSPGGAVPYRPCSGCAIPMGTRSSSFSRRGKAVIVARPARRRSRVTAASGRPEVDVLGRDRPCRAPRLLFVGPVEVRVRDHEVWRRGSPRRRILRRVGVADEGRVVPPDEGAVQRRADACVCLRADDEEPPDAEAREHGLERGVLEGVAVALRDEGLSVVRGKLGDDLPAVAPQREVLVGVLDPDDGDLLPASLLDEAADVCDDCVSLVRALDDAVLNVDDEEGGVRPILECGHGCRLSDAGRRGVPRMRKAPPGAGPFVSSTVLGVQRACDWTSALEKAGWGDATVSATRSCADRSQAMSRARRVRLPPAAAPTIVVTSASMPLAALKPSHAPTSAPLTAAENPTVFVVTDQSR